MKNLKTTLALLVLGSTSLLLTTSCRKAESVAQNQRPASIPAVEVLRVELKSLHWDQSYPARIESPRKVEIRPRVSGILISRSYVEGTLVQGGDELFHIDSEPYELAVERAKAECERAYALERQADREKVRILRLFATEAVSEKQRDDAVSAFELAQAGKLTAEVALRQAELNLSYTRVTSPIEGITGMEVLNEGSLVSSAHVLTEVTQLDPVYVHFAIPEGDPAFRALQQQDLGTSSPITVQLNLTHGPYDYPGTLHFIDSEVDPNTASIRMRATFPNQGRTLLPGQFTRISFADLTLPPGAVIPEAAVLMTGMGAMVYVVGEDNTIEARPVQLGPVLKGGQLVTAGLMEGDRVIFTSLIRLRPGMPVQAIEKGVVSESQPGPVSADE